MFDMIKTAIFDLDGTLIDSLFDLGDSANKSLAELGFPQHPIEDYKMFVGNGAATLCERILPEGRKTEENKKAVLEGFARYYEACGFAHTTAYDGMPELVKKLSAAGVLCAVASNKPDVFSKKVVEKLYGEGAFTLVMGKREGVPTKPQPDIVFNICKELGVGTESAVFIGDSSVDVETAHNAGLPCIGCVWGFRGEKELRDSGCDYIAAAPEDIFRIAAGN